MGFCHWWSYKDQAVENGNYLTICAFVNIYISKFLPHEKNKDLIRGNLTYMYIYS